MGFRKETQVINNNNIEKYNLDDITGTSLWPIDYISIDIDKIPELESQ